MARRQFIVNIMDNNCNISEKIPGMRSVHICGPKTSPPAVFTAPAVVTAPPAVGKPFRSKLISPSRFRKRAQISDEYEKKLRKLEALRKRESHTSPPKGDTARLDMQMGFEDLIPSLSSFVSNEKVRDILEDVLILGYELMRARSFGDYTIATLSFIKRRTKQSLFSSIVKLKVLPFLEEYIRPNFSAELEMQDGLEETITDIRSKMNMWPRMRASPLWRKMSKVIIFATSMTLFGDDLNAKRAVKVEEAYYTSKSVFVADFTHTVMDLLLFVVEKGYQIMRTGKVEVMFHSGTSYEEWYTQSTELIAKSRFLANPELHGIDVHTFTSDISALIEKGTCMYKYACELDKSAKLIIRNTVAQLQTVKASFLNRKNAQKTRAAPFPILVEGHSSIGKSTFANLLHYFYGTICGKDVSLGTRYTRNPMSKYWDGFTSDQWSLLLDDVAFLKPGVSGEVDPTLAEVILVLNNVPYLPDMAALDDKGSAPLRAELVVATTNTPDLSLESYFNVPLAVARRFPYHIRLRPKKQYTKNKIMLDSTKIPPTVQGDYPDWWDIEIYEPQPQAVSNDPKMEWRQTATLKRTHCFTMPKFLKWLAEKIHDHNSTQAKITRTEIGFQNTQICRDCFCPLLMCSCDSSDFYKPMIKHSMQSGFEYGFMTYMWVLMCLSYVGKRVFDFWIRKWSYFLICRKLMVWWQSLTLREQATEYVLDKYGLVPEFGATLRRLGNRVNSKLSTPVLCASLAAGLSTAIAAYKIYSYMRPGPDLQGGISSTLGGTPPPVKERESVWYKDDYEVCSYDMSRLTTSWKNESRERIESVLLRNCIFLRCWNGTQWQTSKAFGLGGQYFLTTNHSIPTFEGTLRCRVTRSAQTDCVNGNIEFSLSEVDLDRDLSCDLAIVRIRSVPPVRCLVELFAPAKMASWRGRGLYLGRNTDGSTFKRSVRGLHKADYWNPTLKINEDTIAGVSDLPTENGDCGAIMLCDTGFGPVIAGIHQLGAPAPDGYRVGAVRVTREYLDQRLEGKHLVDTREPLLDVKSTDSGFQPVLHGKSPVRFIPEGVANVYGSFNKLRSHPRSGVMTTRMCEAMQKRGYTLNYGKPPMKGWRPWRRALLELTNLDTSVDAKEVDICVDALVQDWKAVPKRWADEICIYDVRTVVNGVPGVRFVDKINRKTSAGFPWRKSKKYLSSFIEPYGEVLEPIEFDAEVMDRVDARIADYLSGARSCPIFAAALKDEALKHAKIADFKVRVFMAGSVDLTITMRMFLLSFVRVVQKNKFIFESAPGAEAQSVEWDWFYQFLTAHGDDRCIFGDFRGFDSSMSPVWILAAFEAIAQFHEWAGATSDHVRVIRCMSYDIAFAWVDFNGDLIEFFGKNPSGQALTVIINGIVNCLYMRFVYLRRNPSYECASFKSNVNLLTYGDDNGMNVSASVPWFNHTSIQDTLAEIGVTYTMADKDSESVPYIHIREGSFLKRGWRYEPETNSRVCPLEEDSIVKSLMIGVRSKSVTPEVQGIEIVHSANAEWFWHGREVFDEKHAMLLEIIDECDLSDSANRPLETWDDLMERYKENSLSFLSDTPKPPFVEVNYTLQEGYEDGLPPQCLRCRRRDCPFWNHGGFGFRICRRCYRCRWLHPLPCHCGSEDRCAICSAHTRSTRLRRDIELPSGVIPHLCRVCYDRCLSLQVDEICEICGTQGGTTHARPELREGPFTPSYCDVCYDEAVHDGPIWERSRPATWPQPPN